MFFLSLIMRFGKLNDIKDKGSIKQLLANKCVNNELKSDKYNKFYLLLDLLREIKQAEREGKSKL